MRGPSSAIPHILFLTLTPLKPTQSKAWSLDKLPNGIDNDFSSNKQIGYRYCSVSAIHDYNVTLMNNK